MKQKKAIDAVRIQLSDIIRNVLVMHNGCMGMFYKNLGRHYTAGQTDEEYDTTPIIAVIHDPQVSAYGHMEAATVYDVYLNNENKLFCTLNGESGEDFEEPVEAIAVESLLNIVNWLIEHNFYNPEEYLSDGSINQIITDEAWDFIEKYLSGYRQREDVLRQANLQLFIDGHESIVADEGLTKDEAEDELHHILYNLYFEAIDAYTKGLGVECEHCNSGKGNYCTHCGKLLLPQNQKLEELRTKYIKEIKEIIDQYGKFSTASIMADSSPIVKDDSYTTQLAEEFSADKVTLITYSNETEQEMDEEKVSYEKLGIKVLAEIYSLALDWREENE